MVSKINQIILSILSILVILTTGFIVNYPISIYLILPLFVFFIYLVIFKKNICINRWIIFFFMYTLWNVYVTGVYNIPSAYKWFFPFWISFLTFVLLFNFVSIRNFLNVYIKISSIISVIAIFQVSVAFTNIEILYDYTWLGVQSRPSYINGILRATALFSEPAHLGFFLLFPMYILIRRKEIIKNLHIVIAFLLTFSVGTYMSLIIILVGSKIISKEINIKFFYYSIFLVVTFYCVLYLNKDLSDKFYSLFVSGDDLLLGQNRSAFSVISIIQVNFKAFLDNPIFGYGFGNSDKMFNNYFYSIYQIVDYKHGYSDENFIIKILGHLGLIGIFIFMMIIFLGKNRDYIFLLFFVVISLKSGSYYNPILFMYLSLFIFSGYNNEFKIINYINSKDLD